MNTKCAKGGSSETTAKLNRLVFKLMTGAEGSHTTFDHVNVDGSNVGAVMYITPSSSKTKPDCCGVNIYVSNNVQGVNNSILVGSEVKMGEPGLELSFGDIKLERQIQANSSKDFPRLRFNRMRLFAIVLVVSVLFSLSGVVWNEEMNRFGLSLLLREKREVNNFAT